MKTSGVFTFEAHTSRHGTMAFIYYLTQIHLDLAPSTCFAAECERVGIRRPLVVTDAGVRAVGVLTSLPRSATCRIAVFDQTPSNPTEAAVRCRRVV
jgi:4-hydroxybutyrate dehydrogenase